MATNNQENISENNLSMNVDPSVFNWEDYEIGGVSTDKSGGKTQLLIHKSKNLNRSLISIEINAREMLIIPLLAKV